MIPPRSAAPAHVRREASCLLLSIEGIQIKLVCVGGRCGAAVTGGGAARRGAAAGRYGARKYGLPDSRQQQEETLRQARPPPPITALPPFPMCRIATRGDAALQGGEGPFRWLEEEPPSPSSRGRTSLLRVVAAVCVCWGGGQPALGVGH